MLKARSALILIGVLVGCSEKNEIAERVEARADRRADAMEAAVDSMANALQQNVAEQQATTVREAGEERAEAIRRSQLDPDQLSPEQKAKLVKGEPGTGPAPAR